MYNIKALSSLILVVDDHADSREGCAAMLARSGFRAVTAINGLDGLVKALSLCPDLIVMDLAMPDLDGLDCTRQLAGSPSTRDIPVIALSGHATAEAKALALAAGCRVFLAKPFDPPTLVAEVWRLTGGAPPEAALPV
jgi:CheY-like chemotaxis protein